MPDTARFELHLTPEELILMHSTCLAIILIAMEDDENATETLARLLEAYGRERTARIGSALFERMTALGDHYFTKGDPV